MNKKEIESVVSGNMKYFFGENDELIVAVSQSEHGYEVKKVVETLNQLKTMIESNYCVEFVKSKSKDGKWFIFKQVIIENSVC